MSDASNPPLSEDQERQYREYLDQLRSTPAEQILTEVLSGLLSAAQAKLGRRDARLLIDVNALVIEHVTPYLPPELTKQLDQLLGQLRLGQVQAEQRQAQPAAGGEPAVEPNDLAEQPAPPSPGSRSPGPPGSAPASAPPTAPARPAAAPVSRLWVPGR